VDDRCGRNGPWLFERRTEERRASRKERIHKIGTGGAVDTTTSSPCTGRYNTTR